jgi:hypothetical protein
MENPTIKTSQKRMAIPVKRGMSGGTLASGLERFGR